MTSEAAIPVPAGGQVVFAPGGRHLMLTGLKAPLRAGAKAEIVLRFEKAAPLTPSPPLRQRGSGETVGQARALWPPGTA